ncbi:hypothetical protein [Amycolatopsis sp. NPDC004625]|uniref:hypothetical protein n=1 Tax=Amycolatopsis sp. NPDC004625 TaxID=3154670 RepID=UPI0033B97570
MTVARARPAAAVGKDLARRLIPTGRCARCWLPSADTAVPHCVISNTALHQERL